MRFNRAANLGSPCRPLNAGADLTSEIRFPSLSAYDFSSHSKAFSLSPRTGFQRIAFDGRPFQKTGVPIFLRGDQGLHLAPQPRLRANLIQIGCPLLRLLFQHGSQYFLDFLPPLRSHGRASEFFISR